MNTNIATLTLKNMAAAHRQLQNNMGDAFTTTLSSFRNYLKTTALWFVKDSEGRWSEYGTCDANGIAWTAETLFAYGSEVMKVFKNADNAVFLQNIVPVVENHVMATETTAHDFRSIVEGKPIKVRVNGKVYMGRVVGFKLDYPRIWVREIDADIEFSRQAIIRAVEGDLILDGGTETTPAVETATSPVETTATTPAVETATQTTAPAAKLKMPFNPLQNNAMLHKQIREFLGTDCTVQNVDVEWYEDKEYSVVTTVGTVYEVVLRGDFYVFTKTAETMPPAAELKETTPAMETTAAPATPTPAVETVTNKDPTEDLEYAKAHMEYNFCLVGNYVAYQNAIANQIATEYTAPPVLVKPVIGGFNTQYYRFIKREVELTGAYEVQVGYKDPKRGVARCLFPVTSMDSDRLAVIEMLLNGLFNGLDTLHYQLRKYRMVLNPLANDGMGIVLATDYGGKVHRVPFIITFNGLPVSEIAFGEYRDYLSRNW